MRFATLSLGLLAAGVAGPISAQSTDPAVEAIAFLRVDLDRDGTPDRIGERVTIVGSVTAGPHPGEEGDLRAYVQDDSGGLRLATRDPSLLTALETGDLVRATGRLVRVRGNVALQVEATSRIARDAAPTPLTITTDDLMEEGLEGQLVAIRGRLVVGPDVSVEDEAGRVPVHLRPGLTSDPRFSASLTGGRDVAIVGIVERSAPGTPYATPYRLLPRERADVTFSDAIAWTPNLAGGAVATLALLAVFVWGLSERRRARARGEVVLRHGEVLDRQRRFLAEASHQIRTPLTVMRGSIEVALLRDRSAEEYRDVIEAALDDVKGVTQLANDLITLARTDEGVDLTEMDGVDLESLLSDLVTHFRLGTNGTGTDIGVVIEPGLVAQADPVLLRRAISNVVDNALKYAPGEPVLVEARARRADRIEIEVSDRGPGVPVEEARRIFGRFYRGAGRRPGVQGTGLGLPIARAIMEQHGGGLEMKARQGGGTSFLFWLPRRSPVDARASS